MQWERLERLCEEKQGTLDIFLKVLGSHRTLSKRAGIGSDLCFSGAALRMDGGGGPLRQGLVRRHIPSPASLSSGTGTSKSPAPPPERNGCQPRGEAVASHQTQKVLRHLPLTVGSKFLLSSSSASWGDGA